MFVESEIHPHVPSERAELFHAENGGTTEVEYLSLLASLVLVSKPHLALETGGWTGTGTETLARAMANNGFGRLISVDCDPNACRQVISRVASYGNVDVVTDHSISYLMNYQGPSFDFAFLDSLLPTRADELSVLLTRRLLSRGSLVAIHDTSRVRERQTGIRDQESVEFWKRFDSLLSIYNTAPQSPRLTTFEFPLSRGMLLIRLS